VCPRWLAVSGPVDRCGGALPAELESADEAVFDFRGDVAVGLHEPVTEMVTEAPRLGDFGDVPRRWSTCRLCWNSTAVARLRNPPCELQLVPIR